MFERLTYVLATERYYLQVAVAVSVAALLLGLIVGLLLWFLIQRRRCGPVCDGLHGKPARMWELLAEVLPNKAVGRVLVGLVGYFFWLPVIMMNVLFAAVLLDIFFAGGKRITPPWAPEAGKYYAAALIAAGLLAVVQSFSAVLFSILRRSDHPSQDGVDGFDARRPLFLFIVVMVGFQTGLAIWRSFLMTAGQVGLPTVWEGVLKAGPLVAGLLGFIIPVGEMLLAYAAVEWLITPGVLSTLGGILWGVAGWHVPLPDAASRFQRESRNLEAEARRLQQRVTCLNRKAAGLKKPRGDGDITGDVTSWDSDIKSTRDAWEGEVTALRSQLAAPDADFEGLHRDAKQTETKVWEKYRGLLSRPRELSAEVKNLRRGSRVWNAMCQAVSREDVEHTCIDGRSTACHEMNEGLQKLLAWDGKGTAPAAPHISAAEVQEIQGLIKTSPNGKPPQAQRRARQALNHAHRAVNDAAACLGRAEAALKDSAQSLHGVNGRPGLVAQFAGPVPVPAIAQIKSWLTALGNSRKALVAWVFSTVKSLRGIRKQCARTVPWWRRFLQALLPGWLLQSREKPRRDQNASTAGPQESSASDPAARPAKPRLAGTEQPEASDPPGPIGLQVYFPTPDATHSNTGDADAPVLAHG